MLNKIDLIEEEKREQHLIEIEEQVRALNPSSVILRTTKSQAPLDFFLEAPKSRNEIKAPPTT